MGDNILPTSTRLEWEKTTGPSEGVGICLSGGGIRAAMFSLGVLQVLQEERGLLFGPRAARYVSAVSGGSYIASAYIANGARLASSPADFGQVAAPFSVGSPEEEHLLSNGRYLVTPWFTQVPKAILGVVAGPITLLSTLIWIGFFIALCAVLVLSASRELRLQTWAEGWPWWLATPLGGVALSVLVRSRFAESLRTQMVLYLLGMLGMVTLVPPAMESLYAIETLRTLEGWTTLLLTSMGLVGLSAVIAFVGERLSLPGAVLNRLEKLSVQIFILMLIGATAMFFLTTVLRLYTDTYVANDVAWFLSVLLGPFGAALLLRHTSLHQFYRESLSKAYGVLRTNPERAAVLPGPLLISKTPPRDVGLPQLLISATANVRHKNTFGKIRTFTSFVFSREQCGVPSSEMWFKTSQLELALSDAYLRKGTERLVTLPTSVAATGAAVSVSMGRYTRPSSRLVFALLNMRLGRTLPNAARSERRRQVAALSEPRRIKTKVLFTLGADDLLAELLDVSGPNMYVSDGGHYDNLGLMTLLRARCQTIWCIDAEPDHWGTAAELARIAKIAADELDIHIGFNRDAFTTATRSVYPITHLHGSIDYGAGATGVIHVIKLGLHAETPDQLIAYRDSERAFPHHSTRWQIYPRSRMEAYRNLGRDNCARCLRDVPSP